MSRLVVASNRIWLARTEALAGGVAVAIADVLRDRGGLWFGWSGKLNDRREEGARTEISNRISLAVMDMSRGEYESYYNGHANQCLWPLCHFRLDLMAYDDTNYTAYHRVNLRMASALHRLLEEDDLIWVHDYHLIPLAAKLRSLGARQRIGFFLHIPFPPPDLLVTLPCHGELVRNLLSYDLVGLQTEGDVQRLSDYLEREGKGRIVDGIVEAFGYRSRLGCFPVGVDTGRIGELAFSARSERDVLAMRQSLGDRNQIISVDRLDYTKGLLRRIGAFERLLTSRPDLHGNVELLQIAPVSRSDLQDYQDFRRELESAAARVNGRFARVDWTPVRYLNQAVARGRLMGYYRASKVGLVTPMRDGMNLVCKEYVAAQDPLDPGVLVLSRFAGAAQAMSAALIVNPYDVADTASAIGRALEMPLQERCNRHADLMMHLRNNESSQWAERFIETLGRLENQQEPAATAFEA